MLDSGACLESYSPIDSLQFFGARGELVRMNMAV